MDCRLMNKVEKEVSREPDASFCKVWEVCRLCSDDPVVEAR